MKTLLVALAFALVALPATVNAQDWVMDWNSHGSSVGILTGPFAEGWSISGSSPTTLFAGGRDTQFGLPPNFSAPTYDLAFTWQGRTYGGPVSVQSHFQSPVWAAPVPCAGVFTTSCTISGSDGGGAFGSFAFTDSNHFSLDVVVGTGHSHTELVGFGTRATTTASAVEPGTLIAVATGLLGAGALRRQRPATRA